MTEPDGLAGRIASEISSQIVSGEIAIDTHLSTQDLAEQFSVSRTPVRAALSMLETQGLVRQDRNRGYFVERVSGRAKSALLKAHTNCGTDAPHVYYQLAEDWLKDAVPEDVTENFLMERYGLSRSELAAVLTRAASEGWIERKRGYGWRLLPVAKTPAAQTQLYRMRLILEPAAFLEPTFVIDRPALERIRASASRILNGANLEWPADRLLGVGINFHEELMRMSGNVFLHQAVVRLNRMRKLLEYRSMVDRPRVATEASEHLKILEPLLSGDLIETSFRMRMHVAGALERKQTRDHQFGFYMKKSHH